MNPTCNLATLIATDTTGAVDLLVADLTFDRTAQEAAFLAAYKAALQAADGRTSADLDTRFRMIFSRWYLKNQG